MNNQKEINNVVSNPVELIKLIQSRNKIPEIPFQDTWNNGTGYFDGAEKEPLEGPCTSTDKSGRSLLIYPTPLGNVIAFQRYSDSDCSIVCWCGSEIIMRAAGIKPNPTLKEFEDITGYHAGADGGKVFKTGGRIPAICYAMKIVTGTDTD